MSEKEVLMVSKAMRRRIGYSLSYEAIAIVCTTIFLVIAGNDPVRSFPVAIATSLIAIVWNLIWNTIFEFFESRFKLKGRSAAIRSLHAIGFEGGMALISIPVLAWMLGVSVLEAFITEAGLLVFFLIYTYVFNFLFDKIFGLPESAR